MPRMLTYKEITYIYRLVKRNEKADKIWCKGLSEPTSLKTTISPYPYSKAYLLISFNRYTK